MPRLGVGLGIGLGRRRVRRAATPGVLRASTGFFAINGQDAALRAALLLGAAQGSFALSGQAANLVYSNSGNRTLTADMASLVITGEAMTPLTDYKIPAAQASFTLTGQAATLTKSSAFAINPISGANQFDNAGGSSFTVTLPAGNVIVVFGSRDAGGTNAATGVTIGGQTATKIIGYLNAGGGTPNSVEAWYATGVPAGSGTIAITYSAPNARTGIDAYGVPGFNPANVATGSDNNSSGPAATVTVPSGGGVIAAFFDIGGFDTGARSATPAGLNNIDADMAINGAQGFASFHAAPGALSGSTAMTMTSNATSAPAGVFVAFGP